MSDQPQRSAAEKAQIATQISGLEQQVAQRDTAILNLEQQVSIAKGRKREPLEAQLAAAREERTAIIQEANTLRAELGLPMVIPSSAPQTPGPSVPAVAPKKKRSLLRTGCLGLIGLIVLFVAIYALMNMGSGSGTAAQPTSAPAVVAVDEQVPTDVAADIAPTEVAALAGGVTFGEPVDLSASGIGMIAVPVTNDGETVKTFTAKATYKTGDEIAGTAIGTVNDLLPGQTRAVTMISQETIPTTFDSVRVDVDTMISDRESTPGSEAAQQITFGSPKMTTTGGIGMADVEVTNNDDATHTFTVQAAIMQDGKL